MIKTIFFRLAVVVYALSAIVQAETPGLHVAAPLPAYFSHGVVDLKKSVVAAQDSFEETYVQTLLNNEKFFDEAYNNNLVITTEIDWDFAQNGVVFMKLIDFLEKKEGSDAKVMLTKLNELFYLLFHRHLSHLELPREKQVDAVRALHYLFDFKDAKGDAVLRSNLTRILIYTMMVEVLGLHYYEKKEVVFFALEDFRAALKFGVSGVANNTLALSEIDAFINTLAAYGMKEPVIKPHNFKKWIVIACIVAAIVGVCWSIGTWDRFKEIVDDLVKSATKAFSDTLVENFSKPTAKAMVEELKDPELGAQLGAAMVHGMTYEDVDAPDVDPAVKRPNRKIAALGKMLGGELGEGIKEKAADLGLELGKGFKENAADLGTDLGEGLLEGLVNENPKRKAPKGRRPNRNLEKIVGKGRALADDAIDDIADVASKVRIIGGGIPPRAARRAARAAVRAQEARGDEENAGGAEDLGGGDADIGDDSGPKRGRGGRGAARRKSAVAPKPKRGGRGAKAKPMPRDEDVENPGPDAHDSADGGVDAGASGVPGPRDEAEGDEARGGEGEGRDGIRPPAPPVDPKPASSWRNAWGLFGKKR